jgi:hypothetical protein
VNVTIDQAQLETAGRLINAFAAQATVVLGDIERSVTSLPPEVAGIIGPAAAEAVSSIRTQVQALSLLAGQLTRTAADVGAAAQREVPAVLGEVGQPVALPAAGPGAPVPRILLPPLRPGVSVVSAKRGKRGRHPPRAGTGAAPDPQLPPPVPNPRDGVTVVIPAREPGRPVQPPPPPSHPVVTNQPPAGLDVVIPLIVIGEYVKRRFGGRK